MKSRPRASDAQRTAVLHALDDAFAAGRLDHLEHFERTRTATRAKFIDELRPLVADLRGGDDDLGLGSDEPDPDHEQPHGRTRSNGRMGTVFAAGIVVLAVVGGAVAAAVSSGGSSEPSPPGPLHTQEGVTRLLAETKSGFAGQEIDSLLIWGEYASLMQEDPINPERRLTYSFRGQWEENRTDSISADSTLRVDAIDPTDFMAAINGTPEALDIDPDEAVTSHVQVSADTLGDPEYRVSASEGEDGDLGTATFGSAGELREVQEP